jgi:hypothetical protein
LSEADPLSGALIAVIVLVSLIAVAFIGGLIALRFG